MAARASDRGDSAGTPLNFAAAIGDTLKAIRSRSAFDPVTVVTPSIYSAFYLRRALAPRGLFNVRFTRLEDLAETIAGPGSRAPLSHLVASELIYAVASEAKFRMPQLDAVRLHPSFHEALHRTFTELESAPPRVVEAAAGADQLRGELIGLYRAYERRAAAYERRSELVERALSALSTAGYAAELGRIVVCSAERPPAAYARVQEALASVPGTVVLQPPSNDPDYGSTRCVSTPDPAGEVAWIVRNVVSSGSNVPFSRMAVFYADPAYGRRLEEAFALAGVPVSGPESAPLIERPEGRFVDRALDALAGRGFRLVRKDVIDWIATTPVRPPATRTEFHASRWDAVSRNAGITRDLGEWQKRLSSYATRQEDHGRRRFEHGEIDEATASGLRAEAGEARSLLAFVEELAATRRPPDSPATWTAYSGWLHDLVERYLDSDAVAPESFERTLKLCRNLAALDAAGGPPPGLDRFVSVVRRELAQTTGGGRALGAGVFVAPLRFAVGTDFELVHIAGMVEGAYPPGAADDPLLPDEVRNRVDPEGRLDRRQTRQERARARYVAALAAGTSSVLLWPRSEPGASRRSWPSRWFVEAVRKVSGRPRLQSGDLLDERIDGVEFADTQERALGALDPGVCADLHELDIHSLLTWRNGAGSVIDHFLARIEGARLGRGIRMERARRAGAWTEYDGDLTGASGAISTGSSPVSATSLEVWAACPFRYFLGNALRLKPSASPEEAFEISPLDRGALIHGILEDYFERTARGDASSPGSRRSAMREALAAGLDRAESVYITGRRVMWRLERERITRDLLAFVDQESERAERLGTRQRHAEFGFGIRPGGIAPVRVDLPESGSVQFRGVIDRVELDEGESTAVVVDYKTGSATPYRGLKDDPVDHGRRLQLPIYAEAVRSAFPQVRTVGAQYWFVSERGGYRLVPESPVDAREAMLRAVSAITKGISSGIFIARPGVPRQNTFENCQICNFDQLCSSARVRQWDQKSLDPRVATYRSLVGGEEEPAE